MKKMWQRKGITKWKPKTIKEDLIKIKNLDPDMLSILNSMDKLVGKIERDK